MPSRSTYQTYTVAKGDTLSAIAGRFGSSVTAIAQASGIEDPNKIQVGQSLLIPVDDLSEVVVTAQPISSSPKSDPRASITPPAISLADYVAPWFQPPRLYYTLAAIAAAAYMILKKRK